MNQINIKEYFKTEKEKLRLAVIEPPSLTIVDGNQIYIKKKTGRGYVSYKKTVI